MNEPTRVRVVTSVLVVLGQVLLGGTTEAGAGACTDRHSIM